MDDGYGAYVAQQLAGPLGRVVAGVWGALWGSFFNVLIVRLPAGESVVRPASHCRACGAPVAWYDNLPLLSYLALRGRCRRCSARFSPRYLFVELLVAGLAVALHHQLVVQGTGPLGGRLAQLVITSLFCGLLVAVTFIDIATLRIPDVITYPAIPLAAVLSLFMGHPHLWDGAVGAVAGYLAIRLLADGYQLVTGRLGMGYGDAKLLAVIGGLLGWQALIPTLFLAAFQGSLIGITALLIARRLHPPAAAADAPAKEPPANPDVTPANATDAAGKGPAAERGADAAREDDDADDELEPPSASLRHARIPFGPFLSLAAAELIFLRDLLATFFPFFY